MAQRITTILTLLERVTAYSILAPLSLALRQALLRVSSDQLDNRVNPEILALESLQEIAQQFRPLLAEADSPPKSESAVFAYLAEHPEGRRIFSALDQFLDDFGYLSEVATDIAVPTWREQPQAVKTLLAEFLQQPDRPAANPAPAAPARSVRQVQARLALKGQVNEVYNRLLAALRACFVDQACHWLSQEKLQTAEDIFFLTWPEVQAQLTAEDATAWPRLQAQVAARKAAWQQDGQLPQPPYLVYGNDPPRVDVAPATVSQGQRLQGIGASPGQIEGEVKILSSLDAAESVDRQMILVVPYTDAGWAPLLARIGGLIAEVGGQLSHGAIIAREYGVPAVMNVPDATHRLVNGQRVRLDGQRGTVEIL
jgi:pyruvate,water dikinase